MERCPKCGNKLSPIDVLCPRCGALVEVIQVKKNFIPASDGESAPAHKFERPNLVVYNEDFPSNGLYSEPEEPESSQAEGRPLPDAGAFPEMPVIPGSPDFSGFTSEPESAEASSPPPEHTPDFHLPEWPKAADLVGASEPPAEEAPSDSRMARRAREKKWLEIEEVDPSAAGNPEAELLAEADALLPRQEADVDSDDDIMSGGDDIVSDTGNVRPSATERRYRARQESAVKTFRKVQVSRLPVPAIVILWAMAAAVIFLGFFFLNRYVQNNYDGYPAFIRAITNGKIDLDTSAASLDAIDVAAAVSQTADGAPAHTFTISAPGATSVHVLPTGDTFDMQGGKATFTLADEALAKSLGVVTYENTLAADSISFDFTMGSNTLHYPVQSFELSLLASEYTREEPLQAESTTSDETVPFSLVVAPGATVFVNNENYSDKVDSDGRLSVDLPLPSMDKNYFAVDVIQPGRQAVKDSFTVSRQSAETALVPETEYQRVFSDNFECRGTTEAGATLSAQLNGKTFAGLVADDGTFSVACTAADYGLYWVKLTAASEGKADAEKTVAVERLPERDAFIKSARKMTTAQVVNDAAKLSGVSIQLTGTTADLISETQTLTQSFTLGSGDNTLSCRYHGQDVTLSPDKSYTFYGMLDDTSEGFYVMFVE